jgi:adapter protein MecA 1/2
VEAVTFQVVPKGDGLELYISKNMTKEKFSELPFLQELDLQQTNDFDVESVDEMIYFEVDKRPSILMSKKMACHVSIEWMNQVTGGKINQHVYKESQETPKHLPTSAPNKKRKVAICIYV